VQDHRSSVRRPQENSDERSAAGAEPLFAADGHRARQEIAENMENLGHSALSV
jgi:hypothetical protein